jgi:116 kDa U5 small nuclear ribonucleoprotein component
MASFEDYDEFGNYIGADLDSDDEDEIPQNEFLQQQQQQQHQAPLEGFDDDEDVPMESEGGALMEVDDGMPLLSPISFAIEPLSYVYSSF